MMEFLALGPLEVRADGRPVKLGGRLQRAVLARLLVAAGAAVSADRLVEDLWRGHPSSRAASGLQAYVSNLRRVLEPDRLPRAPARVLVSQPAGYALRVAVESVDTMRFETQIRDGVAALERGRPELAAQTLQTALGQWRDIPYADLAGEAWLITEAARLTELRLVARENWAQAQLALGQAPAVVPALDALTAEAPLREAAWRLLAVALYRCGRQGEALTALRRLRARLADELGLDPSPAVRELETQLLAQHPSLDWRAPVVERRVPAADTTRLPPPEQQAEMSPIGRTRPFRRLLRAARAVERQRRRQLMIVAGEPGVGKTCLVEALARWCRSAGWRCGWGGAHEGDGAPPLWPWRRILGQLPGEDLPAPLRSTRENAGSPPAGSGDAAAARFALHAAVAGRLEAGADVPTLVVIDDLQWADDASLRLLADLAGLLGAAPVLVVVTLRTGEVNDALAETLSTLARHGVTRLTLNGLLPADVGALARAHLGPVDDHLVDVLSARTGGNPFFVHELLELADAEGHQAALDAVPAGVADVLRRRIARLPLPSRQILTTAAVGGRNVDIELLVDTVDLSPDEVWDGLDDAVVAGILVESDTGLAFGHDLMRQTLYVDLPPMARARMHRNLASVLEKRESVEPAVLAEHYCRAGSTAAEHAVHHAVVAARDAAHRLAPSDAAGWWARAVQAARLTPGEPRRLVELLLAQLAAQTDAGDSTGARATRAAAVRAADLADDDQLSARALTAVDPAAIRGLRAGDQGASDTLGRMEQVLERLPDADSPLRARPLATLGAECDDDPADQRCETATGGRDGPAAG